MKHLKRLASILLAMVMVLAMGITAFATEPEGDTKPTSTERKYEIYQIFTGTYDTESKKLSDIKWGQNGTGKAGEKVSEEVLKALTDIEPDATDTEKLSEIEKYAVLAGEDVTPFKSASTDLEYKGLPAGYYLVKEVTESLGEGEAYTINVVEVVDGTLTIKPKTGVPEVDKKIVEGTDKVEANGASIGSDINYEVTGTLHDRIDDYQKYFYQFTDTFSAGLTYNDDAIVKIGDVDVTAYFTVNFDENNRTLKVTINNLKSLNDIDGVEITKTTKIVVTYSAKLNESAVVAGDGNTNKVKLEYSNDPSHSSNGADDPKGETPEDKVITYTTGIEITKRAESETGAFLPGVEFTLSGNGMNIVLVTTEEFVEAEDGTYYKLKDGTYTETEPTTGEDGNEDKYADTETKYKKENKVVTKGSNQTETKVTGIVGEDGKVTFDGLGVGDYTLTESKTPAGYNTIEPISFTIGFNESLKSFTVTSISKGIKVDNNKITTTIVNTSGSLLPSTGGIGTTIFYIVGGVLIVGAAILLIAKKRAR